jgi:biotin synthase
MMKEEEILEGAEWAYTSRITDRSFLQSGERDDPRFLSISLNEYLKENQEAIRRKTRHNNFIGRANQRNVSAMVRCRCAHRYLLRVETTNPDLYRKLHPEDHSLQNTN